MEKQSQAGSARPHPAQTMTRPLLSQVQIQGLAGWGLPANPISPYFAFQGPSSVRPAMRSPPLPTPQAVHAAAATTSESLCKSPVHQAVGFQAGLGPMPHLPCTPVLLPNRWVLMGPALPVNPGCVALSCPHGQVHGARQGRACCPLIPVRHVPAQIRWAPLQCAGLCRALLCRHAGRPLHQSPPGPPACLPTTCPPPRPPRPPPPPPPPSRHPSYRHAAPCG